MMFKRYSGNIVVSLVLLVLFLPIIHAMKNPSAVYCSEMDYDYVIINDVGYCMVDESNIYDAFEFYTGRVGLEYGYCAKQGLNRSVVRDAQYCILPNHTRASVDVLMDLDFNDLVFIDTDECGDNYCGTDEVDSCPEDCGNPVSDNDNTETVSEGLNESSVPGESTPENLSRVPDVQGEGSFFIILVILLIVSILSILLFWFFNRKKGSKKGNVLSIIIIIPAMLAFAVLINEVTSTQGSPEELKYNLLNQDYESAATNIFTAVDSAVMSSLRDYCLTGYAKNSSVWIENIDLVPGDAEKRDALFYYINKTLLNRFQLFYVRDQSQSKYSVDANNLEIELTPADYGGFDGYDVELNNLKLSLTEPKGFIYYNYSFTFPDIWKIYASLKNYIEGDSTKDLLEDISELTDGTQCSDHNCQCGYSPITTDSEVLIENYIKLSDVQSIIDSYKEKLRSYMQSKGVECDLTDVTNVENQISIDILSSPLGYVCPSDLKGPVMTVTSVGASDDTPDCNPEDPDCIEPFDGCCFSDDRGDTDCLPEDACCHPLDEGCPESNACCESDDPTCPPGSPSCYLNEDAVLPDPYPNSFSSADLIVWSPEMQSYPDQPLPYQSLPIGLYDYDVIYRQGFSREGSRNLSVIEWPVNLSLASNPSTDVHGTPDSGSSVIVKRLWRGTSSLIEVKCKVRDMMAYGADPALPEAISNLQTRVFLRVNVLATCGMPFDSVDFQQMTVSCGGCSSLQCVDGGYSVACQSVECPPASSPESDSEPGSDPGPSPSPSSDPGPSPSPSSDPGPEPAPPPPPPPPPPPVPPPEVP